MHRYVAAMREDIEIVPARPGIVDDDNGAGLVRDLGDRRHILHLHRLRSGALAIDDARRRAHEA